MNPVVTAASEAAAHVRVAFATVGCRLNQYDTAGIQTLLEDRGYRTVPFEERAEIYVINTCTVTAKADHDNRAIIRRAVVRNPQATVVVTGCHAQTDPEAVAAIPGVSVVVGNQEKFQLPDLLELASQRAAPLIRVGEVARARTIPATPIAKFGSYTRAFVKVQDGCQHRCAFCIIPFARGQSRSQPVEALREQVETLVEGGYGEIVLTGVDMGHYGWDLRPRTTLAHLLRELMAIRGLRRLRLSSILPAYVTEELMEVLTGSERICRHLHIPLQSGSDRVLRAMRRPYNVAIYRKLVARLAGEMPDLALGTDVIVGFPGESEEDFQATHHLVEDLPFSYLHVFAYSPRRGTEAAGMAAFVPPYLVKARSYRLRTLGRAKAWAFRSRFVGRDLEGLVLEARDGTTGKLVGLTEHYLEVLFDGDEGLKRTFAPLRVIQVFGDRVFGVPASANPRSPHRPPDDGLAREGGSVLSAARRP